MILVDSSVWIDYFRGSASPQVDKLDQVLGHQLVVVGDLILVEVLQGFRQEPDFEQAKRLMTALPVLPLVGEKISLLAAENFRLLRSQGITVRKTIDTLIATFAIHHRIPLLYSDRDFEPFVAQLGLISAL
ncbi:type II toxin-antitoxin system VapC family toxin [Thermostichus vulcanus]|uniref:Ribonuclease VapC n=1 Tax=Thermostichus vulcanus str. 'Rupite' TaxID=2813851 RepID=A0ABT0CB23_THEVL|nr:PIN domain nuclease [Thermostichus vulcanus str. 'Rupite']